MTPYISVYLFLMFFIFIKPDKSMFFVIFVSLSLFLTLSYTNGIDWTVYQSAYEYEPHKTRGIEYGYTYLVILFKTIGLNFEFFKFIVLTLCLYYILKFIFVQTIQPAYVILILFQTFLLGNFFEPAIRQLIALTFLLFSVQYLFNRNIIKYLLTVTLGALFHQSMIFLLILPFILRYVNFFSILALILLGFIFAPLLNSFIGYMTLIPFFRDYSFYLDSNFLTGIDLSFFNICKVGIYALPFYLLRNYKNNELRFIVLRNLAYLFFLCFMMQFSLMLFYRFNYYFVIFYVVYVSFIFDLYRNENLKRITFVLFYIMIHFVSLIKGIEYYRTRDSMKYFPYTNYLIEYINGTTYDTPQEKINTRIQSRLRDNPYK